jgi:hypothetical protein
MPPKPRPISSEERKQPYEDAVIIDDFDKEPTAAEVEEYENSLQPEVVASRYDKPLPATEEPAPAAPLPFAAPVAPQQPAAASAKAPTSTTSPSTALVPSKASRNLPSITNATDPDGMLEWGRIIYEGKYFPKIQSPEAAVVTLLMSRTLKIPEMLGFTMLHLIDGKPILSADLMRFLLDRAGVRYTVEHNRDYMTNPASQQGDYLTRIRMVHEATQKDVYWELWWSECVLAEWTKTNAKTWAKYPKVMQLHACVRTCARFYFPAILGGVYDADEMGLSDSETFAVEQ